MTMPHLMNCPHSVDGWCLACVKDLWDEIQQLREGSQKASSAAAEHISTLSRAIAGTSASADRTANELAEIKRHLLSIKVFAIRQGEIESERAAQLIGLLKSKIKGMQRDTSRFRPGKRCWIASIWYHWSAAESAAFTDLRRLAEWVYEVEERRELGHELSSQLLPLSSSSLRSQLLSGQEVMVRCACTLKVTCHTIA